MDKDNSSKFAIKISVFYFICSISFLFIALVVENIILTIICWILFLFLFLFSAVVFFSRNVTITQVSNDENLEKLNTNKKQIQDEQYKGEKELGQKKKEEQKAKREEEHQKEEDLKSKQEDEQIFNYERKYQIEKEERAKKKIEYKKILNDIVLVPVSISKIGIKRNKYGDMPKYTSLNIKKDATLIYSFSDYIVVDVETTGLRPASNRIIEVCMVKFRDFKPVEYMQTLVNPNTNIPEEATKINGISNDMVKDAPLIRNVAQSFLDFIGDEKILVAHNISFDLEFLYCSGINVFLEKRKYVDTLSMARGCLTKGNLHGDVYNYTLQELSGHFEIYVPESHRAMS
ncbi:MAG: 3'-5' exonuclease, partial [Defluviitaleaceae bacterium]|nr:3'-5' exonuclease [Defluviitaleaceae bacterium]